MRPRTPRSSRGLAPSTSTVPRDGGVRPQSIRNSVDLPAPFGPSSAVTPSSIPKLTSLTATTEPKNFDTVFAAIIPLGGTGASDTGGPDADDTDDAAVGERSGGGSAPDPPTVGGGRLLIARSPISSNATR